MSWDEGRFDRFADATIRMATGQMPGYGLPHVMLPYAPSNELYCLDQLRSALRSRLTYAGLTSDTIAVAPLVARAAVRYRNRVLHGADDFRRIGETLSSILATSVAASIAERTRQLAAGTVLVLCRLGALHPFAHVSSLLAAVHGAGVENTLAVAYPGSADGIQLRFLGLNDATGGYRGHIVT